MNWFNRLVLGALLLPLCLSVPAFAYSGGLGTAVSPWLISSVEDWEELTHSSEDWSGHFLVTAPLDFQDVPLDPIGYDPDGTAAQSYFSGVLDGGHHQLDNMEIEVRDQKEVGLFGHIKGGVIRNLRVYGLGVHGTENVGGLAARLEDSTVNGCAFFGLVSSDNGAGAIACFADNSQILNSVAEVAVIAQSGDGGAFTKVFTNGTIKNCQVRNSTSVESGSAGTFAVLLQNSRLEYCVSYASLMALQEDAGGIATEIENSTLFRCQSATAAAVCGRNGGGIAAVARNTEFRECFSLAGSQNIEGKAGDCLGGFVGRGENCRFIDCFARGGVMATSQGGGFAGALTTTIPGASLLRNCYSAGGVLSPGAKVGPMAAVCQGVTVQSSYYSIEKSYLPVAIDACGIGKEDDDMIVPNSTRTYVGWDFKKTWTVDGKNENEINQMYPWLRNNRPDYEVSFDNIDEIIANGAKQPSYEEVINGQTPTDPGNEGETNGQNPTGPGNEEETNGQNPTGPTGPDSSTPAEDRGGCAGCGCGKKSVQGPVKDLLGDWLLVALSLGVLLSGSILAKKD